MKRLIAFLWTCLLLAATTPASAALYLSGDTNIFGAGGTSFASLTANTRFVRNIAGSNVLLQETSADSLAGRAADVASYLTSQGIANAVVADGATLTAANFAGRSLFIAVAPTNGYTSGEIAAMSAFLASGGSILLTGENSNSAFATVNASVNAALLALGSGMALVPDTLGSGFNTATIVTANAATAGTTGFQYAATSRVTGGTTLYATGGGIGFLAFEPGAVAGVPEPATWMMMIGGFGLVGGALRRRQGALRPA